MKTVIADKSVWPKVEPWKPYPRDILGRAITERKQPVKKKKKPFIGISYEGQIQKLVKKLKEK
jgi:hypothetical protein